MAVNRQLNVLGQMRLDVPHLRSIESGICYDFDAVGLLITGGVPCVIRGFNISNYSTAVGLSASSLILVTGDGELVHPGASDSGSIFKVPTNRAPEVLNSNNSRIQGSWSQNAVNYVGVDLKRTADPTTSDSVRFLNTVPNTESDRTVPLARTLDYVIVISNQPFSISPAVAPLWIVTTDVNNAVTALQDARTLLYRNGSGGDSPTSNNPFGWPGGRNEGNPALAAVAGDRSITSLKQWLNAAMTRFQEIAGGEYWYSLTADRNVKMIQGGVFDSNGQAFEWVGSNLHWKGLKFLFDNSTAKINPVADQETDLAGLTDLADGECIYVDLNRFVDNTTLVVHKAVLATLGGSGTPGQRWVIATRVGNEIFVRDQSYPVGGAFVLATVSAVGTLRTTINANGSITHPVAVGLGNSAGAFYTATCGGLSHNTDLGVSTFLNAGNLVIGRGNSAGDGGVFIQSDTEGLPIILYGKTVYGTSSKPAVQIIQGAPAVGNVIAEFGIGTGDLPSSGNYGVSSLVTIDNDGGISQARASQIVSPRNGFSKTIIRPDKIYAGVVDAIFGPGQGIFAGYVEDPPGTFTKTLTTAISSSDLNGVEPVEGMRVVGYWPTSQPSAGSVVYGIFTLVNLGGNPDHAIIQRDATVLQNGTTVYNTATTGLYASSFLKFVAEDPIVVGTSYMNIIPTTNDVRDQYCVVWWNGKVTPIAESDPYYITVPT